MLAILGGVAVVAATTVFFNQAINGTIPGVSVYSDSSYTTHASMTITTVTSPFTETFYLKNFGSSAVVVTPLATVSGVQGSDVVTCTWSAPTISLAASGGVGSTNSVILTVTATGTPGDTYTVNVSFSY